MNSGVVGVKTPIRMYRSEKHFHSIEVGIYSVASAHGKLFLFKKGTRYINHYEKYNRIYM